MIYYGDEVGLEGENDPGCRGTMPHSQDPAARVLLAPPLRGSMLKSIPYAAVDGFIVSGLEYDRGEVSAESISTVSPTSTSLRRRLPGSRSLAAAASDHGSDGDDGRDVQSGNDHPQQPAEIQ